MHIYLILDYKFKVMYLKISEFFLSFQISTWYLVPKKGFIPWILMNFMKHQWNRYVILYLSYYK